MKADDTGISYFSTSLEDINQTLNRELNLLMQWLQGKKLSLNILKASLNDHDNELDDGNDNEDDDND